MQYNLFWIFSTYCVGHGDGDGVGHGGQDGGDGVGHGGRDGGDGVGHGVQDGGDGGVGHGGQDGGDGDGGGDSDSNADDDDDHEAIPVFDWHVPYNYQPDIPQFRAHPGVLVDTTNMETPMEYFRYFLDEELLDLMVNETNRYGQQYKDAHPDLPRYSEHRKWTDVDRREMNIFLGLTFLMGIMKKPVLTDFWATSPLLLTPIFSAVMLRSRYLGILRYWHLVDNTNAPDPRDPARDRMFKLRPLLDHLNRKFQDAYQPQREICIDESVLLYKGRIIFKQYLPLKRARFGIKIFSLCESVTGYTYKFRVYSGKDAPDDDIYTHGPRVPGGTKTDHLTAFMVSELLDMGHHIYVDNWYSSLRLFHFLQTRQTQACGTMRKNRAPNQIKNIPVEVGRTVFRRSENMLVLKYRPKATKTVIVATTIHTEETRQVQEGRGNRRHEVQKAKAILDYNMNMGGVDRVDQVDMKNFLL